MIEPTRSHKNTNFRTSGVFFSQVSMSGCANNTILAWKIRIIKDKEKEASSAVVFVH